MPTNLSNFAARLRDLIQTAQYPVSDTEFNTLALELFTLQFAQNSLYRRICEARRIVPGAVGHWSEIPSVPTAAFKELELSCLQLAQRRCVFHSSGTTEQRPSRHFHSPESLRIYEASLWAWFSRNLIPDWNSRVPDYRLVILTPSPEKATHSSLVHMCEVVRQRLSPASNVFVGRIGEENSWQLDFDSACRAFDGSRRDGKPVLLLGTAFSFVQLLDELDATGRRFLLPRGSRVMETGGYKGRTRVLPKAELHDLITEQLGVPTSHIICEYGMSELSSQAYDAQIPGGSRMFQFPPWARAQIISPETGREVADGETGLIRVFDLANVFSVLAVQTEDLGVRRGEGFELIGRAPEAEPRGCSLMTA